MFQTKVVEKIKSQILCSVAFFFKSCRLWDNVKNIVERGRPQMTIWRMRTACWIPKATYTLRLCSTHCFSTAKMVTRTRLNVTLCVHLCLVKDYDWTEFYIFSPYREVNTLRLGYKNRSINVVQEINCCFYEQHKTHKYTLQWKRRIIRY